MAVKVQTYPLGQCRRRVSFCYKVQAMAAAAAAAAAAANQTAMEAINHVAGDSASESPQVFGLLSSVNSTSSESEQPIGALANPRHKRQKTHEYPRELGQPTIVLLLGSIGDVGSTPRLAEFQQDR